MEKITVSPQWTVEERETLHAMILEKQLKTDEEEASERGKGRGREFHEKMQLKMRDYYFLMVLLKDDYSARHLEEKREKFHEFIRI